MSCSALSWLPASLEVGGYAFVAAPRMRGMVEVTHGNEVAAGLWGQFLRGDRSFAAALAARLVPLTVSTGTKAVRVTGGPS